MLRSLMLMVLTPFFLASAISAHAQWLPLNPVQSIEQTADGAELKLQNGYLKFRVCNGSMVRVTFSLEKEIPQRPDLILVKTSWPKANFTLNTADAKAITLSTDQIKIIIDRANSALVFQDSAGKKLA